jgi:GT2 family glycosyltransferase
VEDNRGAPAVVATVLAFSPSAHLESTIRGVARQTVRPELVIVLDNGKDPEGTSAVCDDILGSCGVGYVVLPAGGNVGVGAGHNRLAAEAVRHRASWVWMLEHDTICDADCLQDLLATVARSGDERLAAVVPNLARNDHERALADHHTEANGEEVGVIADRFTFNGVLISTAGLLDVGAFREDLFVGGEDWDYSNRLSDRGWLVHQRRRVTGIHPTRGDHRHGVLPPPSRQYYSVRSTLLRGDSLQQRLRLAAIACSGSVRDLARPQRLRRIAARLAGVVDGLRGVGGRRDGWFMR